MFVYLEYIFKNNSAEEGVNVSEVSLFRITEVSKRDRLPDITEVAVKGIATEKRDFNISHRGLSHSVFDSSRR